MINIKKFKSKKLKKEKQIKVKLIDLPKYKELVGREINIVRQGGKYHYDYQDVSKIRIFKGARIKKEKGIKWIYWYWESEGRYLDFDCGFSGIVINKDSNKNYLVIPKNFIITKLKKGER